MAEKIKNQWFLFGLVLIFASVIFDTTGILARIGVFLKGRNGPSFMIVLIFLFSGLIIETEQIKAGIKDFKATLAALVIIVIISPILALIFTFIPLETGLLIGLFIVAVMPTTLSSGVVMTGKAGGNLAQALFITILSNCIAIISIPFVLPLLISFLKLETDLFIDQKIILIKLLFLVLLPLITGLFLKKTLLNITAVQKNKLGIINQSIVLGIVYISLSGAREILLTQPTVFLWILPVVIVFHLMLIGISFGCSHMLNIGRGRREAVIFMGSQKTLPLAVMVQITCFPEFGTALLLCVMHHIVHLVIDGFLAAKME